MKSALLFDFTVDKKNNTIEINREFDAGSDLVWEAWTNYEILDRWWAPKPWISKTKRMEFKEGGRRFYAMIGPEGQEHWSIQEFTSIDPETNFKFLDAFTDKSENINPEVPGSEWDLNFSEQDGRTRVNITIRHKSLNDLEQIIQMGFKEGFTMALGELDNILSDSKK